MQSEAAPSLPGSSRLGWLPPQRTPPPAVDPAQADRVPSTTPLLACNPPPPRWKPLKSLLAHPHLYLTGKESLRAASRPGPSQPRHRRPSLGAPLLSLPPPLPAVTRASSSTRDAATAKAPAPPSGAPLRAHGPPRPPVRGSVFEHEHLTPAVRVAARSLLRRNRHLPKNAYTLHSLHRTRRARCVPALRSRLRVFA